MNILHCSFCPVSALTKHFHVRQAYPAVEDFIPHGTTLTVKCKSTREFSWAFCQSGQWTVEDKEYVEPPSFEQCPNTLMFYPGDNKDTAFISWDKPVVIDNKDKGLEPTQIKGPPPASEQGVNTYNVKYTVTDLAGNEGTECSFDIVIKHYDVVFPNSTEPAYTELQITDISLQKPFVVTFHIQCQTTCQGTWNHFTLEVPCSIGHYYSNGECLSCAIGTYQDETGQTFCVSCPKGMTTEGTDSISIDDLSIILAVCISIPILVIIVVVIVVICRQNGTTIQSSYFSNDGFEFDTITLGISSLPPVGYSLSPTKPRHGEAKQISNLSEDEHWRPIQRRECWTPEPMNSIEVDW
ncbi:unnamed protein product [Mytilus coruscus]|uniref:HYR domain-containing protein n=1 Tax=Mytilus coruscus TaxID=42192 RepID=A0A6J8A6B8_MYTCO|nr:unnamed protein product [Mytilus coruscus]